MLYSGMGGRCRGRRGSEQALAVSIGNKTIRDTALVSERFASEMLVGAETMQEWDITIKDRNRKTKVIDCRDMRDPRITGVG